MSFLNHIKQVAPRLSLIKSRQPAMLLGNKVIVAGIGGNFIPGAQSSSDSTSTAVADISAGYITISDSIVTLHDITKGTTSIADKIYIPDTGVEEPDYAAGGTPQPVPVGMDFYKCTTIDTSTHTWTGLKSVFDTTTGVYSFLSLSTSGLSYTSIVPIPTKTYSTDALIQATLYTGFPSLGLVFYAPLDSSDSTARTGQSVTKYGTVTYQILQNIPCARFYGNGRLQCSATNMPIGSGARTVSLWLKCTSVTKSYMFAYGQLNSTALFSLMILNGKLGFVGWGADYNVDNSYTLTNWVHYLATYLNGTIKLYVNGVLDRSISQSLNTGSGYIYIGSRPSGSLPFYGYISSVRVYNRALAAELITLLASEFNS